MAGLLVELVRQRDISDCSGSAETGGVTCCVLYTQP